MSYTPELVTEFAFGHPPFEELTDDDWTDISRYVLSVNPTRGRDSELDDFSAGTCTLVLQNNDRRFDPLFVGLPAGPYSTAVTYGASSASTATGTTSASVAYPSGITAGQLLVIAASSKYWPNVPTIADAAWTLVEQRSAGAGSSGADSGAVTSSVWVKVADGTESGSVAITHTSGNVIAARMFRLTGDAAAEWTWSAHSGEDTTVNATWSVTTDEGPTLKVDGVGTGIALVITSTNGDFAGAPSSPALTIPGLTVGARTQRLSGTSSTGDDAGLFVHSAPLTAGTGTGAAATFSGSISSTGNTPAGASIVLAIGYRPIVPAPYVDQLLPNVPVRIRAKIGDEHSPVWRGFADGFDYVPGTFEGTMTVECTDLFGILATKKLSVSPYRDAVLADEPLMYLPLGDKGTDRAVDLSANHTDGTYLNVGPGDQAQDPIVPYAPGRSVRIHRPATQRSGVWDNGVGDIDPPLSLEMWVTTDDPVQVDEPVKSLVAYRRDAVVWFNLYAFQAGAFDGFYPEGTPLVALTRDGTYEDWAVNILDGQPHHVVLTISAGGDPTLYIDDVLLPIARTGLSFGAPPNLPAGMLLGTHPEYPDNWPGRLSDWTIWDRELSASEVHDHWVSATSPWDGDFTGARINRVCDLVGLPASMRAIDAGSYPVGIAEVDGRYALDYLRSIANSEQGRLFVDASGRLTFHSRDRFTTATVERDVEFTFSDTTDRIIVEPSIRLALNKTFVFNEARVARGSGSTEQTAEDAESIARYGPRTRELSNLALRNDRDARQLAEFIVFRYKDPQTRASSFTINPELHPETWAAVLSLEVGHRIALELTPQGVGDPIVIELHAEMFAHDATDDEWTITLTGSPVDNTNYFTWGSAGSGWGDGAWR